MTKTSWEKKATNLLKAEMAKRGTSYEQLRMKLAEIGVIKTPGNLRKTVALGKFPFSFLLQCAEAINIKKIIMDDE